MVTPMMGNRLPPDLPFAIDTGCYAAPEKFDPLGYLRWLAERRHLADRCLFATAPDVWGDAKATMKTAGVYFPIIRALGYKAALVAQDGLTPQMVDWDAIDCLFVGGSDAWRTSRPHDELVREARRQGIWLHLGRVNSWRRLKAAHVQGYDSADGTYIAFGPDINGPKLAGWVTRLASQPPLFRW